MAGTLKHAFVSAKTNTSNSSKVQPSNWNADHAFGGGAMGSLLYRDTGATDGANWLADVATGSVLVSGGVGSAPAFSATPTLTDLTLTGVLKVADGAAGTPSITFTNDTLRGVFGSGSGSAGIVAVTINGTERTRWRAGGTGESIWVAGGVGIGAAANPIAPDLFLLREAAQTLAQRNSTNAQRFLVYNTYTDASNYERASIGYSSNTLVIGPEQAGTGSSRQMKLSGTGATTSISFATAGSDRWRINGSNFGFEAVTDNAQDIGASGANRPRSIFAAAGITAAGATSGLGYATGAGGTVTQLTSKATGVTLSKVTGQITLNAAALAADTTVSFVLTNTAIAATDLLILNHISGGTVGSYLLEAQAAAGSATIVVRNITPGSLSEAIVISFAVLKAVTA